MVKTAVHFAFYMHSLGFPGGSVVKNLPSSAGDTGNEGLIPGSGRFPREGHSSPLQYSCLGNPRNRGAWQSTVHGVAKSRPRLSDWAHTHMHSPFISGTVTQLDFRRYIRWIFPGRVQFMDEFISVLSLLHCSFE